jgi:predicted ATPase
MTRQIEAWLGDLFPGVVLDIQRVPNANLATMGLRNSAATDFHRPQHVGYGMTYALPILASLLVAEPGDIVAIENPEAHLHPRAQVAISNLFVKAAGAGIQVVVETHSDHVLNSIRVAVHQRTLPNGDVAVQFFGRQVEGRFPPPRELTLDERGRFHERPDGFFDEFERQLSYLLLPP